MSKASRLKQLRDDIGTIGGCLAVSVLVLGSIAFQTLQAQSAQQVQQEKAQQQQAQREKVERDRKAQIEANAKAWISWRDYIEPQCTVDIPRLQRNASYRNLRIDGKAGKVYEGLVLCDRNAVGILQGAMLRATYVVPRNGSPFPMPSEAPPPEFAPSSQSSIPQ